MGEAARGIRRATMITAAAAMVMVSLSPAAWADSGPGPAAEAGRFDQSTRVGVHNTYELARYPRLADALGAGAGMIEIDVWTNQAAPGWRVSHENPIGNYNNCANGADFAAATGQVAGAGDFASCLDDLRRWHDANPGHQPVVVKLEMKDGFSTRNGRGPAELDSLLRDRLGESLFTPADLIGDAPSLDEAARRGYWPAREAMAGRFLFEMIPGTIEKAVPLNPQLTDVEYAQHLQALHDGGRFSDAAVFPAVHGFDQGDARAARFGDLAKWFVVFDGDARDLVRGDSRWYRDLGYLVVATDAQLVEPAIDAVAPTPEQARARVELLAEHSASVVSSDWVTLPEVVGVEIGRG